MRALLPLDATPLTRGIELLADAVGAGERIRAEQRERSEVEALLAEHPDPSPELPVAERTAALAAVFDAQERALLLCARRLDEVERGAG